MAELCQGRLKHPDVTVVVTSGPQVLDLAMFGAGVPHGPYGMLPARTPRCWQRAEVWASGSSLKPSVHSW